MAKRKWQKNVDIPSSKAGKMIVTIYSETEKEESWTYGVVWLILRSQIEYLTQSKVPLWTACVSPPNKAPAIQEIVYLYSRTMFIT